MTHLAPYGSWQSPVSPALISRGSVGLQLIDLDGERVVWSELRPFEGGRTALLEAALDGGGRRELGPADLNVRSLVHEYGGGAARAQRGWRLTVDYESQQILVLEGPARGRRPFLLGRRGERHADMDLSPDGRWLACVCERPFSDREHQNLIEVLPTSGGAPVIVDQAHDFYACPRFSPDGRRLSFLSWDHPRMPWDGTTLRVVDWRAGKGGTPLCVAGGENEAVFQPSWSPSGELAFVSDRSGFWNLYRLAGDEVQPLTSGRIEFGRPLWVLGQVTYDYLDEHRLVAAGTDRGTDRLFVLDAATGRLEREIETGLVSIEGLRASRGRVALVGARTDRPASLLVLDLERGTSCEVKRSVETPLTASDLSVPEPLSFPSEDGITAHAFFYPPRNAAFAAPPGERPPLVVQCHGGPTANAGPALRLSTQFWTSRGLAVADVNYRGSTGYGRAYRCALDGRWGEADLADCRAAARALVDAGRVDARRLAIRGGSAGGFTALCAATFCRDFAAAASHFGIADLESLARDTHKFESRYVHRLVGPLPEARELYVRRSPLYHVDQIHTPLLILQGLEDRVVPPDQAERMVAALERRGVTHAYVTFPDESHGFRRAENIERALLSELHFYGHVFGFRPADPFSLEIRGPHPR